MDTWNNRLYGSVKVTVQGDFSEKEAFNCFSGTIITTVTYNDQITDEQVNACVEWLTTKFGSEEEAGLLDGESYKDFCEGTGTVGGMTFQNMLDVGWDNYFQELSEIGIINVKINKEKYDGNNLDYNDSCQKDVVIPSVIDKIKVTTIGNGIKYIGLNAFEKETSSSANSNINLSSITIDKTCEEIKNIEASPDNSTKYYPWLNMTDLGENSYGAPYTYPGVTIYSSNGEICDSFE